MPKPSQVFLSYAREDRATARRLWIDLKSAGFDPWIDTENIPVGLDWEPVIEEAIKASSFVVAILSTTSVQKRGYVQSEIRQALKVLDQMPGDDEIFIIPVRLDNCRPRHAGLAKLQWIDFFPSYESGFQKLLQAISPDYRTESLAKGQHVLAVEHHADHSASAAGAVHGPPDEVRSQVMAHLSTFMTESAFDYQMALNILAETRLPEEIWDDLIRVLTKCSSNNIYSALESFFGSHELAGPAIDLPSSRLCLSVKPLETFTQMLHLSNMRYFGQRAIDSCIDNVLSSPVRRWGHATAREPRGVGTPPSPRGAAPARRIASCGGRPNGRGGSA